MKIKIKKSQVSLVLLVLIFSLTITGTQNQSVEPQSNPEAPRTSAGEITIVTPENKTYTEPDSGYYPATYGFENDADGDDPSGWTQFGSGGTIEVIFDIGGHNKILEFHDTSGAGYVAAEQNIGINRDVDGDTIEFWWRTTNSVNSFGVTLFDEGKSGYLTEVRIMDGYFKFNNGTDWQDFIQCNNNQWYHQKIVINFTNNEFEWAIDNTIRQAGIPFWNTSVTNLRSIYIGSSYSQSSYDNFIDAIGYSWDPDYTIGDNLNEGLLLSYDNTTTLDWKGYSLDGQSNKTIFGNTTIPMLADGLHRVQVFCNNSVGTMYESDLRYFSLITGPPEITMNSPSPSQTIGNIAPSYDISIAGLYDSIWYTLDGGATNVTISSLTGTINQAAWNALADGIVTLTFYVDNSAGFEGSAQVQVIKDSSEEPPSEPPGIPGYNLIALIGITLTVMIILVRRKFKK